MGIIFKEMLGDIVECYVDDLVVKSHQRNDHLKHLEVVCDKLFKHQLGMKPLTCAFGVTTSKFLGFIVHHRATEVDPSKLRWLWSSSLEKHPRTQRVTRPPRIYLQVHLNFVWVMSIFIQAYEERCALRPTMFRGTANVYLISPPVLATPIKGKAFVP